MLKVVFKVNGGMGTLLVRANFIQYFYNKYSDICQIDVFGHNSASVNEGIFSDNNCYDSVYLGSQWRDEFVSSYDVVIFLDLLPDVVKLDIHEPISGELKGLVDILSKWKSFKAIDNNERFFKWVRESKPYVYSWLAANGKSIIDSLDIYNDFDIKDEYILKLPKPSDESVDHILSGYGLTRGEFITIQRGANPKLKYSNLPKLWPVEYYNDLVTKIKARDPNIKIVQIGERTATSQELEGIDCCLLDRTNYEELKALLIGSKLHIDSECGMVHLRKALNAGPSLVFFGPTLPGIFGYKNNINLRSNVCNLGCAEFFDHWEHICLRGEKCPPCMKALTPDVVFDAVSDILFEDQIISDCIDHKPTNTDRILNELRENPNVLLNESWVDSWLKNQKIFAYSFVPIKLRDLTFQKFVGGDKKWVLLPMSDSPVVAYLQGNKEPYYLDAALRKAQLDDNPHSEKRLISLIESIDKQGYDNRYKIFVDSVNHIMDGYHRASWLYNKYGPDYEVEVIRVYGDWWGGI